MTAAPPLRVVLGSGIVDASQRKTELLTALLEGGHSVTVGSPEDSGPGATAGVSPLDHSTLVVLEDTPNTTSHEETDPDSGVAVRIRGVADLAPAQVVELVTAEADEAPGAWKPWFPVIDYDRCTNCMQCLSFCLFGVYDVDEEKQIDVAEPHRCKTNCPACSRVCPEVAILFPKYRGGPINGDEVKADDVSREKMKTDISSLLGGDIYSLLRKRHERANTRFSKERDEARALKERQRCLVALQEKLDIPDEVLAALPTAEAIRRKATDRIEARSPGSQDREDRPRNPETDPR